MSLRWAMEQLSPKLREQAQRQLTALRAGSAIRTRHDGHERIEIPRGPSEPEALLAMHLEAYGITYVREYRFAPPRRWRLDFVIEGQTPIGIEVDGVLHGEVGRHQRAQGFEDDAEKQNAAVLLGYLVLRFTPRQVRRGQAIDTIRRALGKVPRET